jgi:hypothetical protein
VRDVRDAEELAALRPPAKQGVHLLGVGDAEEAQVVGAGEQDVALVGVLAVAQGAREVRRQQHVRRVEPGEEVVERTEDPDVGVDVQDLAVPRAKSWRSRNGFTAVDSSMTS